MNANSFHLSVQGASHIKKNKECQDASISYQDENCALAVVCDGHGGDDYVRSSTGAKFGCAVAKENIINFMNALDKESFFATPDKHLKNLEASIINGWNESITSYHDANPFLDDELSVISEKARKKYVEDGRIESAYGTTLIAVAMNQDYWFGIHIGDGKCVAINPAGEFKQPIPWDPKCFLNATTSICDSDAIERFRHFYSDKLPAAVFVGSDGIDDCFSNNDQLNNLYKTVLYSFGTSDFEEAYEGLKDYLPRLSAKGSGDDVSVAAILDIDIISELSIVKDFDREKEKARVEENARKEAERNEAEKRRVEEEHARFKQQQKANTKTEQTSPKFCSNCGERIQPGVSFCSNCGSRINYPAAPIVTPTTQNESRIIKTTPYSTEPEQHGTRSMAIMQDEDSDIKIEESSGTVAVEESAVSDINPAESTPETESVIEVETNEDKTETAVVEDEVASVKDENEDDETVASYSTAEMEQFHHVEETAESEDITIEEDTKSDQGENPASSETLGQYESQTVNQEVEDNGGSEQKVTQDTDI